MLFIFQSLRVLPAFCSLGFFTFWGNQKYSFSGSLADEGKGMTEEEAENAEIIPRKHLES
jgi:hypothetical protein